MDAFCRPNKQVNLEPRSTDLVNKTNALKFQHQVHCKSLQSFETNPAGGNRIVCNRHSNAPEFGTVRIWREIEQFLAGELSTSEDLNW